MARSPSTGSVSRRQGARRSPASENHHGSPVRKADSLALSAAHVKVLQGIAARAGVLILGLLFFWGTLAPKLLGLDHVTATRYAGAFQVTLLGAHFLNALYPSVKDLTPNARKMGFVVFWFTATLFFDMAWQKPLWNIPFIRHRVKALKPEDLWWAITWWCYGTSDSLYKDCTPMMITFEIWWTLGNIPGAIGLFKFRKGKFNQALVLFILCGVLQCYNATVYLFMNWYVDHMTMVDDNLTSYYVYWAFNGMWAFFSLYASHLAWEMLVKRVG